MSQRPFVIVGASLTGASAAAQLREDGFDGPVVLIGAEPQRPYERPPLSKEYLRGESAREKAFVHEASFYDEHAIELRSSTRVVAIEPGSREVILDDDARLGYERLLLATGASPRRLQIPGADLPGVQYLRTIEDADAIRDAAATADAVAVIGGGWIGAEVSASLRQLGLPVTMVAPGSVPLERVLGPEVGAVYLDLHLQHGVELAMGRHVTAIRGTDRVEAVETSDGARVEANLVVIGIGAQPRTQVATDAGLTVNDGIVVDEYLETSVPGVFAAGDVAAAWHPLLNARIRLEHWDNAKRQGRAAARNMLGLAEPYDRLPYFFSDQYDLGMEYVGHAPTWDRVVLRGDLTGHEFLAFWLKEGHVVAGMNANVWDVNHAIAALVRSGKVVALERLVDPSVPIDDIEALMAPVGSGAA
jgi:3-phenylpropionate/trans-cinnamate dioxygenase ferredoxin reductase subunit